MTTTVVHVSAEVDYDVVIGTDLLGALPAMVTGADRVAVIHAPTQRSLAHLLGDALSDTGLTITMIELPDAEDAKTSSVADVLGRPWRCGLHAK